MRIKEDWKDMGTYYFNGLFHKEKEGSRLWIRTSKDKHGMGYEPIWQYIWGSWWFGVLLAILWVGVLLLKIYLNRG